MSKFIVTGARGYVARRLIRRLVANGHEVIGLTRGVAEVGGALGYSELSVGDYTDEALLIRAIRNAKAVFHLAGRAHQRSNGLDDSSLFHEANVLPSVAIARACAKSGVKRLVMVSSIGVLGNRTDLDAFSDMSISRPVDLYAVSKAEAELQMVKILSEVDCSYCILRPPLIYGPGSPGNFAHLVAVAASAPLIPLGGVQAPRTFIYVEHFIDALVVAATHPSASRRTFVISDGADTSVSEIIRTAVEIFGRGRWRVIDLPEALLWMLGILAGQRSKIDKLLAPLRVNATGFQDATGWRPRQSTQKAIAETIRDWPDIHRT